MNIIKNILLKEACNLSITKENRLVFAQSQAPRASLSEEQKKEIKKNVEVLESEFEGKGLPKLEAYLKELSKTSIKIENAHFSPVENLVLALANLFRPSNLKGYFFKDLKHVLFDKLNKPENKNEKELLIKNGPYSIKIENGKLTFENNKKSFTYEIDLNRQGRLVDIKERYNNAKEALEDKQKAERTEYRHVIEENKNLNPLIRAYGKNLVGMEKPNAKPGEPVDHYVVMFRDSNGKIDRKQEKEVKIQDLLNLEGLNNSNVHIVLRLTGTTPGGNKFDYNAVYTPQRRTFMRENSDERAKIFDGTQIKIVEYKVETNKPAEQPAAAPEKPGQAPSAGQSVRTETAPAAIAATSESEKAGAQEREGKIDMTRYERADRYASSVLSNDRFEVPVFLREDSHFEKNWNRIDGWFKDSLARPPFNIRNDEGQRKYLQIVIQKYSNSILQPADFFKYKADGKLIYEGGYGRFKKDYKKFSDMLYKGEMKPDDQRWIKVQTAMRGVCDVLESLQRLQQYDKVPETAEQSYRPKFLDVPSLDEKEKKELTGIKYNSLESLLHKNEKAPANIAIGASQKILNEIQSNFKAAEVPDMDLNKYLGSMGGLKMLFMAYGLDNLIAQKCIKKLDETHYVLVKVPASGWQKALLAIRENNPELWDTNKESMAKWEKIRANLDEGVKSKIFIEKIFKAGKSTVAQDINWWKRLWHWEWAKEKKISMEYLGQVTLNTKDFEKHIAEGRGFRDMMEKTSKRIEGTTIYQPQEAEVLSLTNKYIEYGLLSSLIPATNENLPKILDGIVKEFNLQGKITLKQPYAANKIENLRMIKDAIYIKDVNPDLLSEAHIKFIRMGYVLGRQIDTDKNWSETIGEQLSSNPMIRAMQEKALESGASVSQLKEMEQRIHIAVFGLARNQFNANMHPEFMQFGAGAAVGIKLGKWLGQEWHITLAGAGLSGGKTITESFIPVAEIGARAKLGEKVGLRWSLGTTVGFTGASLAIDFPVTKEWDMFAGLSGGVDWKGASAGVGLGIGALWNKDRAEKLAEQKTLAERNMKIIDDLIAKGDISGAANAILTNEHFGQDMIYIKNLAKFDDYALINFYNSPQVREGLLNKARRDLKVRTVTGFGAGIFVGIDAKNPAVQGVSAGAYITFKIPGTQVNYVIRHEHPKYGSYVQSVSAEVELRKKLEKEGLKGDNVVIGEHIIKASTGILYFDAQLGRSHVARPKDSKEAASSLGVKDSEASRDLSQAGSFENIKKTFAEIDIHAEQVPVDPKDPKKGLLIALTPLETADSNVEINIDPALKEKGLILDSANNRILLAASEAKNLFITRAVFKYPYERRDALNLHVITFKANPSQTHMKVREDSPLYIYKYKGEQYRIVQGEAKTGIKLEDSNVMTLEQYREKVGAGAKIESFINHKFEFSMKEGRDMTAKLEDALQIGEKESIRDGKVLQTLGDTWYKKFSGSFDREVGEVKSIDQEGKLKVKTFNNLNKLINPPLNNQEFNLVYSYLIDKSFTTLRTRSKEVVDKRIKIRNELFRKYMERDLKRIKTGNSEKWEAITKGITPAPTPESIANYLMLCMPQNLEDLKEYEKENMEITGNTKYASYTQRLKKLESMPTSFGVDNPKEFRSILTIMKPTKLNINSLDPIQKAAARFILTQLSPLESKNLNTNEGKTAFLKSELALLIISLYDKTKGVSPLIQVLGKTTFAAMTDIYQALKVAERPPRDASSLNTMLELHAAHFTRFAALVNGLREAQLNGEPTYKFENYIFHIEKTDIYAGAYLKCGNGTLALRQRFGITTSETKKQTTARWYSAKTEKNITVIPREGVAYKTLTVGLAYGFKMKMKHKDETPDRHRHHRPRKDEVQNRHTQESNPSTPTRAPGSGRRESPSTGTTENNPPVNQGPGDSI